MAEFVLNEAQEEVLRWIADGCPDGRFVGFGHRTTARALSRRLLVRIAGRGPTWRAEVTPRGQAHIRGEEPPLKSSDVSDRSTGKATPDRNDARPAAQAGQRLSKTEEFVADLIAAGGALKLPLRFGSNGPGARQRAYAAQHSGKLPAGKRITTQVVGDQLEIQLVDGVYTPPAELETVLVPDYVPRHHPVARLFRDDKQRHEVSRVQLARTVRVVHVIATEAQARGWKVTYSTGSDREHNQGRSAAGEGHVSLTVDGHPYGVRLREDGVLHRGAWEQEVSRYRNSTYWGRGERPTGAYDAGATGQLMLTLLDGRNPWQRSGRQRNWSDRQSWALEERLPHLFREIAESAAIATREDEEARRAAARAAEQARIDAIERERLWHIHMATARHDYEQAVRLQQLEDQAEAWARAQHLRRYCDALAQAQDGDRDTAEWLTWARTAVAVLDPTVTPKQLPAVPDPDHQQLQKFMPLGWSTYGPERRPGRW